MGLSMITSTGKKKGKDRILFVAVFLAVLCLSVYFRSSGLFRGIEEVSIFHPDSPKQIMMLNNYLHGSYVQYYGNLFYDGYPYGLNRVDEGMLRSTLPILRAVKSMLNPGFTIDDHRHSLYYAGRILRVLYGMAVVLMLFFTARNAGADKWAALLAGTLYGFAPLGSTVTHSVTGDVGVDLFSSLVLLFASLFAKTARLPLFLFMGLACGMGFACKFQGLLAMGIILLMLVSLAFTGARRMQRLATGLLNTGTGFLAGVVILNPALLNNHIKTWRLMRENFTFIRNYGVSSSFLEKPFIERITYGLSKNLPFALNQLGPWLVLSAFIALILYTVRCSKDLCRERGAGLDREGRQNLFFFGVAAFPFAAILLATALKPAVQAFHFSFILPFLALATAAVLRFSFSRPSLILKVAGAALLCLNLTDQLKHSMLEDYFWKRPDIRNRAFVYAHHTTGNWQLGYCWSNAAKIFYNEPSTKPVFRNRPTWMKAPSLWWEHHNRLPVPSIPYPLQHHWIFMNGVSFPRNDRLLTITAGGNGMHTLPSTAGPPLVRPEQGDFGRWHRRTLVFTNKPDALYLALRTGHLPARYELKLNGQDVRRGLLLPNSETIHHYEKPTVRYTFEHKRPVTGIDLKIRTGVGPLWVTALDDAAEIDVYRGFGPSPDAARYLQDTRRFIKEQGITLLERETDALPYYVFTNVTAVADGTEEAIARYVPLARGAYIITLELDGSTDNTAATLELQTYPEPNGYTTWSKTVKMNAGTDTHRFVLLKEYIPFDGSFTLSAKGGDITCTRMTIQPDIARLADWHRHYTNESEKTVLTANTLDVTYPHIGRLHSFIAGEDRQTQEHVYTVHVELASNISHQIFHDSTIFLHLYNTNGHLIKGLDIALQNASFKTNELFWHPAGVLQPGTYHLRGGLYNTRTRRRYGFKAPPSVDADKGHKHFHITEWTIP